MNCTRVRDLLPDYSVELLDKHAHRAVAEHLSGCADCRAEMHALDATMALVEEHGALEPPVGLFNAVRNRIESGDVVRERPAWWSFLLTGPARVAAMGMASAAVVFGLLLPVRPTQPPVLPIHPVGGPMATSALAGSIRQHALSAGQGPLTDRVAWEAMAQLVTLEKERQKTSGVE